MITLLPDGEIHSCNHYFANMLFGYSQKQLIGKNISYLIPSFYDDLKFLDAEGALFPHFEEEGLEDEDSMVYDELSLSAVVASNDLSEHLDSVHLHELSHISENDSFLVQSDDNHLEVVTGSRSSLRETNVESNCDGEDCVDKDDQHSWCVDKVPNTQDINGNPTEKESKPKDDFDISEEDKCNNIGVSKDHTNEQSVPTSPNVQKPVDILLPKEEYNSPSPPFPSPPSPIEQTEFSKKNLSFKPCHNDFADKPPRILEGSFFGSGRHQDGSELAIVYQVRMVELDDGQVLFCMWVSRDPDEPAEWYRDNSSIGMLSGFNSIYDVSAFNVCNKEEEERVNSRNSVLHKSDDYSLMDCSRGVYSVHYTTLHQIGKGAFGCVKLAFRNMDKSLVVTKFISKEKVYKECWVNDNNLQKMVPLEVSLLMTLEHPNIIKVLDVYENDNYFQMVMEKHGCGTDLFDFIDRSPNLDEPLASYIFRQIVSAVSYLHGLNILHRDIKDENVIIDHEFHIKLIDFGSATFMSPNRTFSTFCGTFEYCSPEVLNGEKYRGPELEMWSLGVTLYTLVYGENPFRDIEETIQADLQFPFPLSFDLMRLITKMLHPDPNLRCTLRELETNSWLCQPVDIDCYLFENVVQCTKCQEYELFT